MPMIEVDGTTFHFEEAGGGSPLLLLHGGLGTAMLHWWQEIPIFAAHHRVVAPDMRGYGRSSPPRAYPPDFYQRDAADMAGLLRALDAHPAHVVGWSDGGVVALVLAVTQPELVRTLTVVSGEAHIMPHERHAWPVLVDTSTWSERAVQRFIDAQGPENWPGIIQRMLAGYNSVLHVRGGHVIEDRLHEIRCPTLIIHGDNDHTVPVEHAYEMHKAIPSSRLHIYSGVDHLPQRERAEDFRARVLDFIDTAVGPPRAEQ
jgi:valacyclovir hydrolase